jgi:hypothetical protein
MKKIAIPLMAMLATALIVSNIGQADAATVRDGPKQLSPKSFGQKTKYIIPSENPLSQDKIKISDGIKKEEVKTFKKNMEQYKAAEFMKAYYYIRG